MIYTDRLVLAGCALLLLGVSRLMNGRGGDSTALQNLSALSLALSVVAAGVSVGLFFAH